MTENRAMVNADRDVSGYSNSFQTAYTRSTIALLALLRYNLVFTFVD